MIVLSQDTFFELFIGCAFGPLTLLVCLFFPRPAAKRLLIASFIFFLPAALLTALALFNRANTDPPMGEGGMLYLFFGLEVVVAGCALSLACGVFCVRRYPWSAIWLVPAAVVVACTIGLLLHGAR